jgi:hypothetical protein
MRVFNGGSDRSVRTHGLEPFKDGLDSERRVEAAELHDGVRNVRHALIKGLDDDGEALGVSAHQRAEVAYQLQNNRTSKILRP